MKYLIDSDVLIDYFNKKPRATSILNNFLKTIPIAISAISITEIRSGWSDHMASLRMSRLYDLFRAFEVTKEVAEHAGIWRYTYKTKGVQLSTPDSIIAATAYLHDYSLMTNNTKDYPMPELKLYKPAQKKAA